MTRGEELAFLCWKRQMEAKFGRHWGCNGCAHCNCLLLWRRNQVICDVEKLFE